MTFRFLVAAGATLLAISASAASAQYSVTVAAGATVPLGNLSDLADLGYNAALGLNVGIPLLPVGFRIEGAYDGLQLRNVGGDVRILTGTANAVFNLGRTNDAPYLIAGLGAYTRRLNTDGFGSTGNKTVVGINGGGGLRFPLSGLSTFLEARYHVMFGNKDESTNYQFVPITFGIIF